MSQIFVHSVEATHLAFGLEWLPLVTGKPERSAHRLARQHKASHLVMSTDSAASVGLAFVGRSSPLRRRTVHSAAQIVAQLFEVGTVALVLCLPGSLYWMVAVHEGAVLSRTDVTFEN